MSARMLLPRPEMSTATRFGSRIMRCCPNVVRALHRAAARAFFDSPDAEHRLARSLECCGDIFRLAGANHDNHADAAIERADHLLRLKGSALAEKLEYGRLLPGAAVDEGMAIGRENPRDVFQQATAGDVRQALDPAFLDQRKQRSHVDARRFKQDLAEGAALRPGKTLCQIPSKFGHNAANEREAIAVNARAC